MWCRRARIDLVKLDIEGFELAAIEGMADLLARHTPRVARRRSITSRPTFGSIAFKVKSDVPRHRRFAIRQHGYSGYETVLYADLAH
jgi:hypothetical protein